MATTFSDWEKTQVESFTAWVNYYLNRRGLNCQNVVTDFSDGTLLIALAEELVGTKVTRKYTPNPQDRIRKLDNVGCALDFLKDNGIPLRGISPVDIVDGNTKFILGMIWSMARYSYLRGTNTNPTKPTTYPEPAASEAASAPVEAPSEPINDAQQDQQLIGGLVDFLQRICGRQDISTNGDFVNTLKDGTILAQCVGNIVALDRGTVPYELSYDAIISCSETERSERAINIAKQIYGVPILFSGGAIANGQVDQRSLMLYLTLLHNTEQYVLSKKREPEPQPSAASMQIPEMPRSPPPLPPRTHQTQSFAQSSTAPPLPPRDYYQTSYSTWQQNQAATGYSYPTYSSVPEPIPQQMPPQSPQNVPFAYAAAQSTEVNHFPNEPLGGQYVNGMYVVSSANLRYIPSASEKYQTTITTTTQPKKGRHGIIGTSWAFAKRLLKEASHEIEKVYTVIDDSNAMRRFSKNFQFRDPEPIYGEFATKFFTTASGGEAVMMIGYCYVTENYFCFAGKRASAKGSTERLAATLSLLDIANIQEGISPFLDRYKDVPRITPISPESGMSVNAVIITDTFGRVHEFYSVLSVTQLCSILRVMWRRAAERAGRPLQTVVY